MLPYVKNDVLSTAFCYARYTMGMEELNNFGIKNSSTLPSLTDKVFNSLGDENNEPIYTYTNAFMRNFVRQRIKGSRCSASSQFYKSTISENVFNIFSTELDVIGNICEILDKSFEILNEPEKLYAKEFDSKYDDYRDINQKEKINFINKKPKKLTIHDKYQKLRSR